MLHCGQEPRKLARSRRSNGTADVAQAAARDTQRKKSAADARGRSAQHKSQSRTRPTRGKVPDSASLSQGTQDRKHPRGCSNPLGSAADEHIIYRQLRKAPRRSPGRRRRCSQAQPSNLIGSRAVRHCSGSQIEIPPGLRLHSNVARRDRSDSKKTHETLRALRENSRSVHPLCAVHGQTKSHVRGQPRS